ncbi:MAG: hypothetical protein U0R80_09520 [Nocardioidaceae bacterium]
MTDAERPAPASPSEQPTREPGRVEMGAILFLVGAELFSGLLPFSLLGWMTGIALMALSAVWTMRDKIRGWLFLGAGYPLVEALSLSASDLPRWGLFVGVAVLMVFFVLQVVTVIRLLSVRALGR